MLAVSVSRDLMRESAVMACHYGVSLHTHLAENDNDIAYSREKFGLTPAQYAEDLGWVGHDVLACPPREARRRGDRAVCAHRHGRRALPMFQYAAGFRHRAGARMRDAGVVVGLGVDGSASNDGAHMLGECAPGFAAAARRLWPGGHECSRGTGNCHARRRARAQP
ncbi:amidohydrolase family protein [Cupriavidus basilensis]